MLLSSMPKLPQKAGKAAIQFTAKCGHIPDRKGALIRFPDPRISRFSEMEYYPLMGGRQFVIHLPVHFRLTKDEQRFSGTRTGGWLYFGGTDENPFLVQLDNSVDELISAAMKGKSAFHEAIRPLLVKKLEKLLGGKAKRQGDIFAYPVPFSWDQIIAAEMIFAEYGEELNELDIREVNNFSINDTRHLLTGKFTDGVPGEFCLGFAEGVIRAPDHSPMVLEGPHVLAQTAHLAEPYLAD